MAAILAERPAVAKKRGRPGKPSGEGKAVRLDPDLYAKARIVALRRGVQIGEYLGGLLSSPVDRDYQRVLKELADSESSGK
jgi:hypothetical protein